MLLCIVCMKSSSSATFAGIIEISGTVHPALLGVPHDYNSCITPTSNKRLGRDSCALISITMALVIFVFLDF